MILTRRQWIAFLFIFVIYLLFGATVFYMIESKEEEKKLHHEHLLKLKIEELITMNYPADKQHVLFAKISEYSSKPIGPIKPEVQTVLTWSFYHSIFFVLTVVSTIGFGSLSPTTPFTRVFMIVYGIIGIPINGIVVITMGEYFGATFRKIYRRWKTEDEIRAYSTTGLILRVLGYSIPGFALLIIIPSAIIVFYEGWTFDRAIEFAFGTLTTIGTGQYIPGTIQKEQEDFVYTLYKAFLLIWIIIGLGYLAMFFTFITEGLQSKKMFNLEKKLTRNIKKTNKKIRKELRYLMNDYIFTQTYAKPVYRERRVNALVKHQRTQSCPDLLQVSEVEIPVKKRAISALPPFPCKTVCKMKSDTDLDNIDRIKTFERNISQQHNELLVKVVSALANYNDVEEYTTTITTGEFNEGFEPDEFGSGWMLERNPFVPIQENVNVVAPDQYKSKSQRSQETIEYEKYGKSRSRTLPPIQPTENVFSKLKKTMRKSITGDTRFEQQINDPFQEKPLAEVVQEDTNNDNSLSDFLRALSIINFNEFSRPRKREDTISSDAPKTRRLPIIPTSRRFSLNSSSSSNDTRRRHSESCSSTTKCIKPNFSPHTSSNQATFFPWRRKTKSVIDVMQKLKRSTFKHKNSVVIDID
ncbi:hypothetical protein FQR65_LT05321 [Abscondita terminalis]|nr:hypothetical protein FQR65_LT05321 [Abscondita terminalis]